MCTHMPKNKNTESSREFWLFLISQEKPHWVYGAQYHLWGLHLSFPSQWREKHSFENSNKNFKEGTDMLKWKPLDSARCYVTVGNQRHLAVQGQIWPLLSLWLSWDSDHCIYPRFPVPLLGACVFYSRIKMEMMTVVATQCWHGV